MQFSPFKNLTIASEPTQYAAEESLNMLAVAMLSSEIIVLNEHLQTTVSFQHPEQCKINGLKTNEGLFSVAGDDQKVTFYDPRTSGIVKQIHGMVS